MTWPAMTGPARFLIATWDGGGSTSPAFHLGSRLARRGHRTQMVGWDRRTRQASGRRD
jgi:hypothetical protein